MFRLMIKTHNVTGLNYLCVTQRKEYEKYCGSGIYWTNHLRKHGKNITTYVLFESELKTQEFIDTCLFYSTLFDIVESADWANLVPENANSVGVREKSSQEVCQKIKDGLSKFYDKDNELGNAARVARSEFMKESLKDENMRKKWSEARTAFLQKPGSKEQLSVSGLKFWDTAPDEWLKSHSEATSRGRLNMSDEAKQQRAIRVAESFQNSPARKQFEADMKIKRLGGNNPNSREIVFHGITYYSRKQFEAYLKQNNISKSSAYKILQNPDILDSYFVNPTIRPLLSCVYCGKSSTNHASIHRWHNNNCKYKVTNTPSKSVQFSKEI